MSLATPPELIDNPELAVLDVLDVALLQAVYALFAAHPELVTGEALPADVTAETAIADAIYNQATALQHSLARYREVIITSRQRLGRPAPCCTRTGPSRDFTK